MKNTGLLILGAALATLVVGSGEASARTRCGCAPVARVAHRHVARHVAHARTVAVRKVAVRSVAPAVNAGALLDASRWGVEVLPGRPILPPLVNSYMAPNAEFDAYHDRVPVVLTEGGVGTPRILLPIRRGHSGGF